MEHAVIEIRHPDGPYELADQEYEADWFPKDCIIKLFSHGVNAKRRLAATREETIKTSRHFVQGNISATAAQLTFI